jgi:hypothetical protein
VPGRSSQPRPPPLARARPAPLRCCTAMPSQVQVVLRNLTRACDGEARGGREATRAQSCGSTLARGRSEGRPGA